MFQLMELMSAYFSILPLGFWKTLICREIILGTVALWTWVISLISQNSR